MSELSFEDFANIDWFNIQQITSFMREYPEIGWHGRSLEQISPAWVRGYDDIKFLQKNIDSLFDLCTEAKKNSKFFGRGKKSKGK